LAENTSILILKVPSVVLCSTFRTGTSAAESTEIIRRQRGHRKRLLSTRYDISRRDDIFTAPSNNRGLRQHESRTV